MKARLAIEVKPIDLVYYHGETVSSPGAVSVKPRLDDIDGKPLLPLLTGFVHRDENAAEFAAVCHWHTCACKQVR